jgi:hypothetical protein
MEGVGLSAHLASFRAVDQRTGAVRPVSGEPTGLLLRSLPRKSVPGGHGVPVAGRTDRSSPIQPAFHHARISETFEDGESPGPTPSGRDLRP